MARRAADLSASCIADERGSLIKREGKKREGEKQKKEKVSSLCISYSTSDDVSRSFRCHYCQTKGDEAGVESRDSSLQKKDVQRTTTPQSYRRREKEARFTIYIRPTRFAV